MVHLNRRNEDPNLLWKYHIAPGRFDDQRLYSMGLDKFNQANPRQMTYARPQNNLPTLALPFQVKRKSFCFLSYVCLLGILWCWFLGWNRSIYKCYFGKYWIWSRWNGLGITNIIKPNKCIWQFSST